MVRNLWVKKYKKDTCIMDLKEFVKETIVQVVNGIADANAALSSDTAFVASSNIQTDNNFKYTTDKNGCKHYVTDVDFDVAITVQNSKTQGGGVYITVPVLGEIGGKGSRENTNASISRIKFSLPLALPTEPEDKRYK
jgi:hypothetical protein